MSSFGLKKPFLIPITGLFYFLLVLVGFSLARYNPIFSPIWPAAGCGIAIALLYGRRVLPAIGFASFLATYLSGFSMIAATTLAAGSTIQAYLGSYLLCRYANGTNFLDRVEDVLKFVLLGAVTCSAIGATSGTLSEYIARPADTFQVTFIWTYWWLGELMGILLVTPPIVAWSKKTDIQVPRASTLESGAVFVVLVAVTYLVFGGRFEFTARLSFLMIPLLIWALFRSGPKAATLAITTVSMIALTGARNENGPLQIKESILLLQLFAGCVQLTALILIAHQRERKNAEAILRREEAKSRSLVERVPAIVYQVEFGATVQWRYVSPRIKSILGFAAEEWMNDPQLWFKQIHPQDREEVLAKGMSSSVSGKPFACEYRMFARDGHLVWFRDEGNVIKDPEKKSAFIQGVMLDITDRKRSEILQGVLYRLAEQTSAGQSLPEYYSVVHRCVAELMDARNFYIALFDPSTQLCTFPFAVSERTFPFAEQYAGTGLTGFVARSGPLLADAGKLADLSRRGEIQDDGVPFVSWLGVPLKANENTLGVLSVQSFSFDKQFTHSDMETLQLLAAEVAKTLEQKRSETALRDKTLQLQIIHQATTQFLDSNNWKAASDVILRFMIEETQSEYGFLGLWNGSVLKIKTLETASPGSQIQDRGSTELHGLNHLFGSIVEAASAVISNDVPNDPRSGLLPEGHALLRTFVGVPLKHAGEVMGLIGVANRKDGYTSSELEKMELPCQTAAVLYHCYLQSQKQEQLQDELRQSHKMDAVGRLAGGVAHDFNNLLMTITGYCELLLLKLSGSPLVTEVEEIMKAASQGAALTRQLLAFGRRQILMPKRINLNDVLNGMKDLLTSLLGETELILKCSRPIGLVKADPGQIEQVIINLSLNARDAMTRSGQFILETSEIKVVEDGTVQPFGIPPGSYVVLRAKDNGEGMDEVTLNRIFEPFFTTKKLGEGGGLGLATVYGIVKQSNGHLNVQSELGTGTTFEIYLPRVEPIELPPPTQTLNDSARKVQDPLRTILIVDDNEAVRKATAALLLARGFQVLEASNGPDAISVSEKHSGCIDLLITDVVMPRMSGASLAEKILGKRPNTKVLFMSGYSEETIAPSSNPAATFLQKPFSTGTFFGRIKELLDLSDLPV